MNLSLNRALREASRYQNGKMYMIPSFLNEFVPLIKIDYILKKNLIQMQSKREYSP